MAPPAYPVLSAGPKPPHFRNLTLDRLDRFDSVQDYPTLLDVQELDRTDNSDYIKLEKWSSPGTTKTPFEEAIKKRYSPVNKGELSGPSWTNHWFKVTFTIPKAWVAAKPDRIQFEFDPSAEAMIFNTEGLPLQGITGKSPGNGGNGGNPDRRVEYILPRESWNGTFRLWIEVSCNGMFGNGLGDTNNPPDNNRYFELASADLVMPNMTALGLLQDFSAIKHLAQDLPENSPLGNKCMEVANAIMNVFDPADPASLVAGRKLAEKVFGRGWEEQGADVFKGPKSDVEVAVVGNCHIDTAWLWRYTHTRQKTARSWSTQLDLINRYPEYSFVASQAQQHAWLEKDYPLLFQKIKAAVAEGRFQPIGGAWVEADVQMASGEALCRQFLYGQRYFKSRYGSYSRTFWLPDSFGYSNALPQILRLSAFSSFFTQKMSWSQFNTFPHNTFFWAGQDGTQILCHFTPCDTYTAQASVAEIRKAVNNNKSLAACESSLMAYGNGDGGGGPLAFMLENLRRVRAAANKSGELPKVTSGKSVTDFFDDVLERTEGGKTLPTWTGELYLELHRGTLTSHGIIKKYNRKCEILLREVEFASTLAAALPGGAFAYPKDDLDALWQKTLTNQFHDVLPGSGIALIYEDAEAIYREVTERGSKLFDNALKALLPGSVDARDANADGDELVAVNTTPFARREVVKLPMASARSLAEAELQFSSDGAAYALIDNSEGATVTAAMSMDSFVDAGLKPSRAKAAGQGAVLENGNLRVAINAQGRITSILDIELDREVIAEGHTAGFVIFRDEPLNWDAWDTDVFSLETKADVNASRVKLVEDGPLRSTVELTYHVGEKTVIKARVSLDCVAPIAKADALSQIRFDVEVDWHEKHRFLKWEVPTAIRSEVARFENQFGYAQRPTVRNTTWDRAKFEVCAHKFMDLSEFGYGVSVLNDSKYGCAVEGTTMRLSLLRAPTAPDADSDQYTHAFSFAVLPHRGSFEASDAPVAGWLFNSPMHLRRIPRAKVAGARVVAKAPVWLRGTRNVLMETIKRGEEDHFGEGAGEEERQTVILRLYEAFGGHGTVNVESDWEVEKAVVCDILERDLETLSAVKNDAGLASFALAFRGFEIKTVKLTLAPSSSRKARK